MRSQHFYGSNGKKQGEGERPVSREDEPERPGPLARKLLRRLRPGHHVVHRTYGECRVLYKNDRYYTLALKDRGGEQYRDVPVKDVRPYDERDWKDQVAAMAKKKLYGKGRFRLSSALLSLLRPSRLAQMLDFLTNWQRVYGNSETFYCSDAAIVLKGYIDPRTVTKLLKDLRDKGYISTEVRGKKSRRWITICYERIWADVKEFRKEWREKYRSRFPRKSHE